MHLLHLLKELWTFHLFFSISVCSLINFASFLFLSPLQWVTGGFCVWEISVRLNWNRKSSSLEYFYFQWSVSKSLSASAGVSCISKRCDLRLIWVSSLYLAECSTSEVHQRLNSQMAVSLCLLREKVHWRDKVNELWFWEIFGATFPVSICA